MARNSAVRQAKKTVLATMLHYRIVCRETTMDNLPFFTYISSFFIFSVLGLSFAVDTITSKQSIRDGETLISSSQMFELGFFSSGNSTTRFLGIWYKKSPETVVWVANRNSPIPDLYGVLTFDNNGNLVLLNQTKNAVWSSNISIIIRDPVAQLLESGNFVLLDNGSGTSNESYIWQSFDHPSDTLLPGMKLGWNLRTRQKSDLTSSRSTSDPSPGNFTFTLDVHGVPEFFLLAGMVKKFRTGLWNVNGNSFGGVQILRNPFFNQLLVQNHDEIYYALVPLYDSVVTRVVLSQSGELQYFVMYDWNAGWSQLYSLPYDLCDTYGQCGANAICRLGRIPICECLVGFTPKSQDLDTQTWIESGNCERKILTVDCQREEGFLKIVSVKLPDMLEFRLTEGMDPKECQTECLKNCSCSAYSNMNINGGANGCIMWFGDLMDLREFKRTFRGEDIYIRVPKSELESKRHKSLKIILAVSISTTSSFIILGLVFCIRWKERKRKGMESQKEDFDVPSFDLETIAVATTNFSEANMIGEGGFGYVYKGKLLTGQEIAVKKLSKNSGQGIEEFRSEVILIAKLQHRNLVGLLGSCIQGEERLLIYEYMPNKSLDYFIFENKRITPLPWEKRFNIALGIARGLLYLQQDSRLHIVHRDLKPSNILLDSMMNPKISDFGLARIFGDDGRQAKTKRVVGTYGYMSPEYAIDGKFSVKSDVFSLGVILLEIVSGKRNRGFSHPDHHHHLLGHAWLLWNEGRALELMDGDLEDSCVKSQVLRCIHVGLLCVQKLPEDRPEMTSVVFMLANKGAELPHPKQPGFFVERCSMTDAASRMPEYHTRNTISITELEAR